jgi:hypothetical protein
MIITTGRIRRNLVDKINLLVDSPRSIEAGRRVPINTGSISSLMSVRLQKSSSPRSEQPDSRHNQSFSPILNQLHADRGTLGSATTNSCPMRSSMLGSTPTLHRTTVQVRNRININSNPKALLRLRRASGCLGTLRGSSRGSSRRSSSTTLPRAGSSSTTSPSQARRRQLRLAQARRRLLLLHRASRCLGTSRGSSRGSSRRS